MVMLSGGLDSAVTIAWALETYGRVSAIHFNYGQLAGWAEGPAAEAIWKIAEGYSTHGTFHRVGPISLFARGSSLLGDRQVTQYDSSADAIAGTGTDASYVPLRNLVLGSLAAHYLLATAGVRARNDKPEPLALLMGIRGRSDGPGGYPDCTSAFADTLTNTLRVASDADIEVVDPLNRLAPTRTKTIQMGMAMKAGPAMIAQSISCFAGTRCGKCLPCIRRAQAFAEAGLVDPAS
jgi:7-cyano-7-deazaguanine synthase